MPYNDPNPIQIVHVDCPTDHVSRRLQFVYKNGRCKSFGMTPPEMTAFVRELVECVGPQGCVSFVQPERSRRIVPGKATKVPAVTDNLPSGAETYVEQEEPKKKKVTKKSSPKAEEKEPAKG